LEAQWAVQLTGQLTSQWKGQSEVNSGTGFCSEIG
jgi:hypothetical protein